MKLNSSSKRLRNQSEEAFAAKKSRMKNEGGIGISDCFYFVVGGVLLTAILTGLSLVQSLRP